MAVWTDELVAEACRLWDQDQSAQQIGLQIGMSRNAVIGKLHRLRQAGHPFKRLSLTKEQIAQDAKTLHAAQQAARQRREAAAMERRAVRGGNIARMALRPEPKTFAPPPVIVDASFAKPWTERVFGECAYPIAGEGCDTQSCCAPTHGKTYCAGHRAVMFHKPQDTGKRFINGVARLAA